MAIPEAAVSPFGPDLAGIKDNPEDVIRRVRDDLDELHRAIYTLSQFAAQTDGPDNAELQDQIDALSTQVTALDSRVTTLEGICTSCGTGGSGTGFEPRRGILATRGDPEAYFLNNNPFFWENREVSGKGDIFYVVMRDVTAWVWEPIKMLGLP